MIAPSRGFALIRILAIIAVLLGFAYVAVPRLGSTTTHEGLTWALSNQRQLHLATLTMTLDNEASDRPIGWTCSNSTPLSYLQWKDQLVLGQYLTQENFQRLTSRQRFPDSWSRPPDADIFRVYAVSRYDRDDTLLFATKNWPGPGAERLEDSVVFKKKAFVIFRKDGTGAIYRPRQINDMNLIGTGGTNHFAALH